MAKRICDIDGCLKIQICKKLCGMHYHRLRRNGNPTKVLRNFGTGDTRADRFWSKVNKNGRYMGHMATRCWEWTGRLLNGCHYGEVTFQGKTMSTHRVAWFLTYGKYPVNLTLHKCDNRICVNPEHLYDGTHRQNTQDMFERGRAPQHYGENAPGAKLTTNKVLAIRNDTRVQHIIAQEYSVDTSTISNIKTRKTWKHV